MPVGSPERGWAAGIPALRGFPAATSAPVVPGSNGALPGSRGIPAHCSRCCEVVSEVPRPFLQWVERAGLCALLSYARMGFEWLHDAQGVKIVLRTVRGRLCFSLQDWTSGGIKHSCWSIHVPVSPCDPKCASGRIEIFPWSQMGGGP